MPTNSIQTSEISYRILKKEKKIFTYFVYSPTRIFPGRITTTVVWSDTVNHWGRVAEFGFPPALGRAQLWACWELWMGGSMPSLGKLWRMEGEGSFPACSPESMEGTSISSDSKHSYNYSNNSLYSSTHSKVLMISGF